MKVVREKIPRRAEEVRRRRRASWMIPLQVPLHLHSRLELLSSILEVAMGESWVKVAGRRVACVSRAGLSDSRFGYISPLHFDFKSSSIPRPALTLSPPTSHHVNRILRVEELVQRPSLPWVPEYLL